MQCLPDEVSLVQCLAGGMPLVQCVFPEAPASCTSVGLRK